MQKLRPMKALGVLFKTVIFFIYSFFKKYLYGSQGRQDLIRFNNVSCTIRGSVFANCSVVLREYWTMNNLACWTFLWIFFRWGKGIGGPSGQSAPGVQHGAPAQSCRPLPSLWSSPETGQNQEQTENQQCETYCVWTSFTKRCYNPGGWVVEIEAVTR